jgi:hypothetical protein
MSSFDLQIQPYEEDGLTISYPAQQRTRSMKFDGKDYPDGGQNAIHGGTASGRRVNARTLELTSKINGKVTGTQEIAVSPDLKVLTFTARPASGGTPSIFVFDKE